MHTQSPLLSGHSAFKSQDSPPDFESERQPGLHFAFRRLPAALRLLNPENLIYLGRLREDEAFAGVRYWLDPTRRRLISRPPDRSAPDHAKVIQAFVVYDGNWDLLRWWTKPHAWRSPKEFYGYDPVLARYKLPRVEPFEVAQFRLPDDIACDPDVVLFQAWCQGMTGATFRADRRTVKTDHPFSQRYATAVRAGLQKFCRSPWIQFALAAPFMAATTVVFPPHSYFDSQLRLEYLLQHPFTATDAELEHILASPTFHAGLLQARLTRRFGKYVQPPGHWYVGGSMSRALGDHFRRGGVRMFSTTLSPQIAARV